MDKHIKEFFFASVDGPHSHFHQVIEINDSSGINWDTLSKKVKRMPKGWCELARLSTADRIGFTFDFWNSRLPYHPHLDDSLNRFFSNLDDIAFFITQKKVDDPFEAHMVYSLSNDRGFYKAGIPASEEELFEMQKFFSGFVLPEDYLAFLSIHNGFCKATDCTGLTSAGKMKESYQTFQNMLEQKGIPSTAANRTVNPHSLIPFYESFGMPFYQCFWGEWHPEDEMGNVYYSSTTNTISNVDSQGSSTPETMSFKTFTDWLIFYLETVY
jgi:hypothetical protein